MLMASVVIRALVIAFTVAAISILVTCHESILIFGMNTDVSYTNSSALKFLFAADIVACIFSVLSLASVCFVTRSGSSHPATNFILFLLDTAMVMLAGCAAATAVGYVGQHEQMIWLPICGLMSNLCPRMMI